MSRLMLLLVIGSLILAGCPGRPGTVSDQPGKTVPPPHAAGGAPGSSMGPVLIRYTGSQGTVSFPHADHAARLDCLLCHPSLPPKKLIVDQSFAHATCTACHLNSGTGPTDCRECHVKP